MSHDLNRLTTSMSTLLIGRQGGVQRTSSDVPGAFAQAVDRFNGTRGLAPQGLPKVGDWPLPFAQFALSLDRPSPGLEMPLRAAIRGAETTPALDWSGVWDRLGSAFPQWLDRAVGELTRTLASFQPRAAANREMGITVSRDGSAREAFRYQASGVSLALGDRVRQAASTQPTPWQREEIFLGNREIGRASFTPAAAQFWGDPGSEGLRGLGSVPLGPFPTLGLNQPSLLPRDRAMAMAERGVPPVAQFNPRGGDIPASRRPSPVADPVQRLQEQILQRVTPVQPSGVAHGSSPLGDALPSEPPIQIQGGIHVHITAQPLDPAHAEETARVLADHVLRELNRMTARDRFRRGLSTPSY